MKIGIITQPLTNNYGGLLQNFALQYVLKEMGHEPVTMNWMSKSSIFRQILSRIKQWGYYYLGKSPRPRYKLTTEEFKIISQHNQKFIDDNIMTSEVMHTGVDFKHYVESKKLEVIVVGSDQCWRPSYSCGMISDMYLSFAENLKIRKISYAASFGTDVWELSPSETNHCSQLAKKFDLVTVREDSGIELCKNYLDVDATIVLDPTLLIDRSVYEGIVNRDNTPKSCGTLFHYILDPSAEKSAFISNVAQKMGLTPFTIMPIYQAETRTRSNIKTQIDKCVFPGVKVWLRGFMDAEIVICDSFHGCVFSIIFNKPFWVISNAERGNARFDSLLRMFDLKDRLVNLMHPDSINFDKPINWDRVNSIRKEWIKKSKFLLYDTLKKCS